jgi:hypothetical protein
MGSSKKKTAAKKRVRKTPVNVILSTNSQLLEQVSQTTSAHDTLYGNFFNFEKKTNRDLFLLMGHYGIRQGISTRN